MSKSESLYNILSSKYEIPIGKGSVWKYPWLEVDRLLISEEYIKYLLNDDQVDMSIIRVFAITLNWYDELLLLRLTGSEENFTKSNYFGLLMSNGRLFRLDNSSAGVINMYNKECKVKICAFNVIDYLKFFCFFLDGPGKEWAFLESKEDAEILNLHFGLIDTNIVGGTARPAFLENNYDQIKFECSAITYFNYTIYICNFEVNKDGSITILGNEAIAFIKQKSNVPNELFTSITESCELSSANGSLFNYEWSPIESSLFSHLFNNTIDGTLRLNYKSTEISAISLPWCSGLILLQVFDESWSSGNYRVYYILDMNGSMYRLTGEVQFLSMDWLHVIDEINVLDYLRFFTFFNRRDHIPFYLIESIDDPNIVGEVNTGLMKHISMTSISQVTNNGDYLCKATALYIGNLYTVYFSVSPYGKVKYISDEIIQENSGIKLNAPIV